MYKTGLAGMLEEKESRSLHKESTFVASFLDRSTEYERTEHMTTVPICYDEFVTDGSGETRKPL